MIAWPLLAFAALAPQAPSPWDTVPRLTPIRYALETRVDFAEERLEGRARITVRNVSPRRATTVPLILYRLLTVTTATDAAGRALPFRQTVVAFEDFPQLQVRFAQVRLPRPLAPGDTAVVAVAYGGYLLGYAETGMLYVQDRVDSAFTMIRSDAWAYPQVQVPSFRILRSAGLPSFDYEARITAPEGYVVANVGRLVDRASANGAVTWIYRNLRPAWRMDFAIARFAELTREGGALRVFYFPGDSAGAARVADQAAAALRLLTTWFGPLREAVPYTIVENADGWGSQADVTGIVQAAAAFRDSTRMHEVYHEVSHLWNPPERDSAPPRWNEGLATFLEYRIAEALGGAPEAARAAAVASRLEGVYARRPELADVPMAEFGRRDATDLSYSVGMLFFHVLDAAVGPARFDSVWGGFYQRYATSGATTDEFAAFVRGAAACDVGRLLDDWLYTARWRVRLREAGSLADLAASYGCGRSR